QRRSRQDGFRRLLVKDLHGLTVSTSSADAGAAMERTLSSFLKFRLDAREHLSRSLAADPEFGLAHCLKGYFAMLLYKQAGVAPAAESARTARPLVAKRLRASSPMWTLSTPGLPATSTARSRSGKPSSPTIPPTRSRCGSHT